MLARFENGYFLEARAEIDKEEPEESIFSYEIYDDEMYYINGHWTGYRNLELYYPLNLIDYILQFCEPNDVKGKYELLPFETMEEYEDSLKEDPNGEWCLERQGTKYEDIRYYKSEEAARIVMLEDAEEIAENAENSDLNDDYCEVNGQEYFQCWSIYKRETFNSNKEKLFYDIEKEFERADRGISQYAWELQDTWVISKHLEELEKLVKQLKEMM